MPAAVTGRPVTATVNNRSTTWAKAAAGMCDATGMRGAAGTVTQFNYSDGCSMTINTTANSSVRAAVWASSTHTNSNVMVAYGTFGAGKFVAIGDSSPADDGTGHRSGDSGR